MAILKGAVQYQGSFKSIRHYRNLHSPHVFAGEKGGATKKVILRHPVFVRVRENMTEMRGCGLVAKSMRLALSELLPDQVDPAFTGRLMRLIRRIMQLDPVGERGRRAVCFSSHRELLGALPLNTLISNRIELLQGSYCLSHLPLRGTATLHLQGLQVSPLFWPQGATAFRVMHLLALLSDWSWSAGEKQPSPMSPHNGRSASICSSFVPVGQPLTADLTAGFAPGVEVTLECTVVACVSMQFYQQTADGRYLPLKGGMVKIAAVF